MLKPDYLDLVSDIFSSRKSVKGLTCVISKKGTPLAHSYTTSTKPKLRLSLTFSSGSTGSPQSRCSLPRLRAMVTTWIHVTAEGGYSLERGGGANFM